jgi:Tfp pilus assembly protein PilV
MKKLRELTRKTRPCQGFALEEVMVSMTIAALGIAGIVSGYFLSAELADWSTAFKAAQALAVQRLEQTRAARWDTLASPVVDELVTGNFPQVVSALDIPQTGSNVVYGTNKTTITAVSVNPPLRLIQVDCTWSLFRRGPFTNSVFTYRSPDQ